jgi:hypothetical protein
MSGIYLEQSGRIDSDPHGIAAGAKTLVYLSSGATGLILRTANGNSLSSDLMELARF